MYSIRQGLQSRSITLGPSASERGDLGRLEAARCHLVRERGDEGFERAPRGLRPGPIPDREGA
ncbi:MAG TPA: hypothetical protein VI364_02260, partial [Actinomycetota bacterium]